MEGVPGKIRLFKGLSDLFDRHAVVGKAQGLVVNVFVDIPLFQHERLHLRLPPDQPVVRIDQHLRPITEPGQGFIDHPRPQARITDFGTARVSRLCWVWVQTSAMHSTPCSGRKKVNSSRGLSVPGPSGTQR